jgi:U3 small nucleolar RNA-associated protein 10
VVVVVVVWWWSADHVVCVFFFVLFPFLCFFFFLFSWLPTVPFVTKGRFDLLMEPLTELINTSSFLHPDQYKTFMEDVVTPCVAQFAAAVEDDMMRKTIHHRLLMHTRNDTAAVRVHTIQTIQACFNQVGEDYLYLVPETLPFLAELLEDSNGQVERLAHALKRQVEELSGEGLDTYLVGE